ncbi:MAG: hypothetical protein AB1782_04760 [Cyanobacteriota bacterium]
MKLDLKYFSNESFLNNKLWILALILFTGYFLCSYAYILPVDFIISTDEGDFGRDLYYFYLTSKGQLPYIDFNWIYGPLSPLLYGTVFKIFGVSVFNALTLWYLTFIVCVILQFYAVKQFTNSACGFLSGALFIVYYEGFMIQVFNHIFGPLFILLALILLKHYLDNQNIKFLYIIGFSCFFLMSCKLNIGVAFYSIIYFTLIVTTYLNKKPLKHLFGSLIVTFILTTAFYSFFILNMPLKDLNKCFPYSSNYLASYSNSLVDSLISADYSFMSSYWSTIKPGQLILNLYHWTNINIWYFVIVAAGLILIALIYKKEKTLNIDITYLAILSLVALALSHEYLCIYSTYSLKFWGLSVLIILFFYINSYIINHFELTKPLKITHYTILIAALAGFLVNAYIFILVKPSSQSTVYVGLDRMKISVTHYCWYIVMNDAVKYINESTSPDEKIFALPNNMYYHFVTGRDAPSRYKEFLIISAITKNDELKVIEDIEKHKVNLILYAFKINSEEYGFADLGKKYLKTLDNYIMENYQFDRSFCCKLNTGTICPISFYKRKTDFKQ